MLRLLDTRRPRLLLTLFCLLLWTPGFFSLPPGDRDESRFAQATKQMLETGDFVRIMNGTEERNRKPIGIYWLQAPFVAAAQAAGLARENPIWPYRIPSALGALVAVLGTFAIGELLWGRRVGLLGAGLLAASVVLTVEAHIAKTDAALLGSIVLFMGVLARAYLAPATVGPGRAVLFWLAMAGSILLKGPIGPMVAGLTVLSLVTIDRRAAWLGALRPAWGVPLMLLAVLPWFVAIGAATGGRFFTDALGGDLGRKLSSGDDAHWGPPFMHLLLLPVLILPATAALPGALLRAWRDRSQPVGRLLLCWVVPSWIVFEAVPTKLPHYTLPLYPALCLLSAAWLLQPVRRPIARGWAVLGIAVGAVLAAAVLVVPVGLGEGAWVGLPGAAAALLIAGAFLPLLRRAGPQREQRLTLAAVAAMPLLYWTVLEGELPRLAPVWIAPRVTAALPPGPLGAVGFAEPSLMFLAGTDTKWLRPDEAASALFSGTVHALLVADAAKNAVLADARKLDMHPSVLAPIQGFNYSRGRFVTLWVISSEKQISTR